MSIKVLSDMTKAGVSAFTTGGGASLLGFPVVNSASNIAIPTAGVFTRWVVASFGGTSYTTGDLLRFQSTVNPRVFLLGSVGAFDVEVGAYVIEFQAASSGQGTTLAGWLITREESYLASGYASGTKATKYIGNSGEAGATSGFFEVQEATDDSGSWYPQATGWQHLMQCRHSNPTNNYAMQFAGGFFDQYLYFRKTNNANSPWSKVMLEDSSGNASVKNNFHIVYGGLKFSDLTVQSTAAQQYQSIVEINFGTGANEASTAVDWLTNIPAGAAVHAYIHGDDTTADHTASDHRYAAALLGLTCGTVTAGVGFTLYATSLQAMQGTFKIRIEWSNAILTLPILE